LSQRHRSAAILFYCRPILLGSAKRLFIQLQSVCLTLDPDAGARNRNGLIFAGVGVGAGLSPPLITYIMVHHGWRSSFWVCSIIGFAAGHWFLASRDTPSEHPRVSAKELEIIQIRANHPHRKRGKKTACTVGKGIKEQGSVGRDIQLFLLWLRRLDILQLVLHLPGTSTRLEFESERFLRHVAFLAMAHVHRLAARSRPPNKRRGPRAGRCILAAFAIVTAGVFLAFGSQVESARLASVVLAGRRGSTLPFAKFFLSVTADIAGGSPDLSPDS